MKVSGNDSTPNRARNKKRVYNIVGGTALAAALAFGGGSLLSNAATPTFAQTTTTTPAATQTTAAATTAQATTPSATPGSGTTTTPANGNSKGNRAAGGTGSAGSGRQGGGQGGLQGTIISISGNTITLKRDNVVNIVGTVSSTTTYTDAGKTISLSDLKVNEKVALRETRNSDGTYAISAVEVVLDHQSGTVSAVASDSLTITSKNNTTVKVSLSSATTYTDLGKTISLSDIKSGAKIEVSGTLNSDGSLNAQAVQVQHDRLGGVVTAISGNTVTIQGGGRGAGEAKTGNNTGTANGSTATPAATAATTRTIVVSDATTYTEAGQSVKLSNIAVGDRIEAAGSLSSDGNSLTALQVSISLPSYRGQVTAVSGSTITIQERGGTQTITVDSNTKYLNGTAAASLSDVKAGVSLEAQGQLDSSGKMTASLIQLGQSQGPKGH